MLNSTHSPPQVELAALIESLTGRDGAHQSAIPALSFHRFSRPSQPFHGIYQPTFCLIGQGRKLVMLGEELLPYSPTDFLLGSVDLPIVSHIVEATPQTPYLSLQLNIDPGEIGAMISELGLSDAPGVAGSAAARGRAPARGLAVGAVEVSLIDAVIRLLRLLEQPQHLRALSPLAVREIYYRLLVGTQGAKLRRIAALGSETQGIGAALNWLKANYAEPLRIEEIARCAHMSRSGFHQHFKAVTAMTPLQYQKRLRLQEARRLMLCDETDAATACFRVGYESPSQFSREYRRLFGESPRRDVARLQNDGAGAE